MADQIRVLTAASPAVQTSGPVEMSGAPCSVVENTLENDSAIHLFPERLNYVLPADLMIDAHGAGSGRVALPCLVVTAPRLGG